jgi:hypothetical protein
MVQAKSTHAALPAPSRLSSTGTKITWHTPTLPHSRLTGHDRSDHSTAQHRTQSTTLSRANVKFIPMACDMPAHGMPLTQASVRIRQRAYRTVNPCTNVRERGRPLNQSMFPSSGCWSCCSLGRFQRDAELLQEMNELRTVTVLISSFVERLVLARRQPCDSLLKEK